MPKSNLKYDSEGIALAPKLPFELPPIPDKILLDEVKVEPHHEHSGSHKHNSHHHSSHH